MPSTINDMTLNKPLKSGMHALSWMLVIFLISLPPGVVARNAEPSPPAIVLAEIYRATLDPTRYWVSEKLDGVRAIWDGQTLKFRSGRPVAAPAWFIAGLPPEALDGELWLTRGGFDELSGIVRKAEPVDAEWRRVRYMIFEYPGDAGSFSERLVRLEAIIQRQNQPWLRVVAQFRVASRDELRTEFQRVVRQGGEGLMLHLADAPYVTGRSDVLLKLKPLQDAEARVSAHIPGRGRLSGRLGALEVEMPDGKHFRIGSGLREADRLRPPPVGVTITYRYQELTKDGIPRFPRYWRVRQEF